MSYILLGILIGWMIPRPKFIGDIEIKIWKPIKSKLPKAITNFIDLNNSLNLLI